MNLDRAASVDDFRVLARRRLPRILFDYIDGGSYAEVTLARNTADMMALSLRQRVMRDMSALDLSVELFGRTLAMPVILGPVGFAGMYARRGEVQAARAAQAAGVPFTLSTVGICSVEEVADGAGTPPWFQLYMTRDRGHMRDLLARVAAAGSPILVLTVDLPTPGARYRDLRSGMGRKLDWRGQLAQAADGMAHPHWLRDVYLMGRPHSFGNLAGALPEASSFADAWGWIRDNFDPSVTWADLDFVRAHWRGPIIVKGVLDGDDARAAADAGADGLVVSNHGGRQLDGVRSSISALPRIADAVGDRLTVMVDGGVRSGLDVLKALGLGARAVLLGRSWAFALAAGGEAGVARMLATLREELRAAMVLTGCASVDDAAAERIVDDT
jgi:L-lactate dehydrogenase (cytochrome)